MKLTLLIVTGLILGNAAALLPAPILALLFIATFVGILKALARLFHHAANPTTESEPTNV